MQKKVITGLLDTSKIEGHSDKPWISAKLNSCLVSDYEYYMYRH